MVADGLKDLLMRASSGVLRTPSTVPADHATLDDLLPCSDRGNWQKDAGDLMNSTRPPSSTMVEELITALANRVAANRAVILWAVHHPDLWMTGLQATPGPHPLHETWVKWCWVAEAMWRAVRRDDCVLVEADRRVVEPLAARLRFLVLSEAFRHRGDQGRGWLPPPPGRLEGAQPFLMVFGADSWHLLVARCREARWAWMTYLDGQSSYPPLARARYDDLEREIHRLAFRDEGRSQALRIAPIPLDRSDDAGPDDLAVHRDILEHHLLPRFEIVRAARLALTIRTSRSPRVLAAAVLVAAAAVVLLTTTTRFYPATTAAAVAYVVLTIALLVGGPHLAAPFLLRWPAASALGLIALIGLHPHWWTEPDTLVPVLGRPVPAAAVAGVVLLAAAYAYLVIEVINHGVSPGPARVPRNVQHVVDALGRAAVVLGIGALHALGIGLFGLFVLLPAFAEDGSELIAGLADPTRAYLLLSVTTSWCLAVGVFSQVLWDDKPITALLAHASRRAGRN